MSKPPSAPAEQAERLAEESAVEPGISNLETLRGMRVWLLSSGLSAVYTAITAGAYNTGYALHLGATSAQVGFLSAAASWGQTLQILSPLLIERLRRRRVLCLAAFAVSYGMWLPIALIPWLFAPGLRPLAMIVFVALAGMASATASPASTSWLGDLVPARMRGRFVSRQQMLVAGIGLAGSVLAGQYLDAFPKAQSQAGFTTLFVVAVAFGLAAIVAWAWTPEPPRAPSPPVPLSAVLRLPLADRNLRSLTLFVSARLMAVMIAAPFFNVFMLKQLELPYYRIAIYQGANTVAMILANPIWAYLADKFGYRPVLKISAYGLGMVPVVWFFSTQGNCFVLTPCIMIWAGVMAAGVILAQFNLLIKVAPQENRSVYIGFHSAVVAGASALGAMIGGALGQWFEGFTPLHVWGYEITNLHLVFVVSALGRFGTPGLLGQVAEDRATSARTLLRQVGRGHALTAAWGLVRMARSADPATKADSARVLGHAHSPLPVEELIGLLSDSDREVRREAARALGEIGDERAVEPLSQKALDETSGISLDAIEALGHIPSARGRGLLVSLLASEEAAVREVAAVALGNLGAPEAAQPLQRLLDRETSPTVTLAAARALARTAGPRALNPLRDLLRGTQSEIARRELATALGDLISRPGRLYKLLQADPMRQDEIVERVLHRCRRRLGRLRGMTDPDLHYATRELGEAFADFVRGDHGGMLQTLLHVATRALKLSLPEAGSSSSVLAGTVRDLITLDDRMGMGYDLLSGIAHDARHETASREDALLAVVAFQVAIHRLERLARG